MDWRNILRVDVEHGVYHVPSIYDIGSGGDFTNVQDTVSCIQEQHDGIEGYIKRAARFHANGKKSARYGGMGSLPSLGIIKAFESLELCKQMMLYLNPK